MFVSPEGGIGKVGYRKKDDDHQKVLKGGDDTFKFHIAIRIKFEDKYFPSFIDSSEGGTIVKIPVLQCLFKGPGFIRPAYFVPAIEAEPRVEVILKTVFHPFRGLIDGMVVKAEIEFALTDIYGPHALFIAADAQFIYAEFTGLGEVIMKAVGCIRNPYPGRGEYLLAHIKNNVVLPCDKTSVHEISPYMPARPSRNAYEKSARFRRDIRKNRRIMKNVKVIIR
jgi:hypothetical protein